MTKSPGARQAIEAVIALSTIMSRICDNRYFAEITTAPFKRQPVGVWVWFFETWSLRAFETSNSMNDLKDSKTPDLKES